MQDPYFSRPEVSNSDLSSLKQLLYGSVIHDPTKAYADGTLLDAMITEPDKVDYYSRTVSNISLSDDNYDLYGTALNGYTYSASDFENAKRMKSAFCRDEFGKLILQCCSFQQISVNPEFKIDYCGFEFELAARCKWDFLFPVTWKMGGDIKSTAATTQKEFEAACDYFDYFRSRAWYMDIQGTDKDMLVGISKKNHKVFKISINRGDKLYNYGKEQYSDLAFKYWMFFNDLKITA